MSKLSYMLKEADKVAFVGEHDIVKVGDVGVIEKVLAEEDNEFFRRIWGSGKDYKYQVNFNGTILIVSEEEVVPLSVALLLQL